MIMKREDDLTKIKGVGPKKAELFAKLGIYSVDDLLHYFPRSYDTYGEIVPVRDVQEGSVQVISVRLKNQPSVQRYNGLTVVTCLAYDDTGTIRLTWFNMPYIRQYLKQGTNLLLRGKLSYKRGQFVMEQAKFLTMQDYLRKKAVLQPVYPLTAGLTNTAISKAVQEALAETEPEKDFFSAAVRKEYDLQERQKAVQEIHFPRSFESMTYARKRLVFDEFYRFCLYLRGLKENRTQIASEYVISDFTLPECVRADLPYELTEGQKQVWDEIREDLSGGSVMNRLIQGDVGSGKTVLAMLALLACCGAGYQACLMAPTEVLAQQHFQKFTELLTPYGIRITLLTGSLSAAKKREAYLAISSHETDLVIGTHALIQEGVVYDKLALVVTDEQHRFGVNQRAALAGKGILPHVLVMSATPIPRTLAMILYGDLDLSVLLEKPSNRLPIKNCVVDTRYRPTAYEFIRKQVEEGHQAYIICPMVEESEELDAENVTDYARSLSFVYGDQIRVESLHGRMKAAEKQDIMQRFASGEIQVLVSTTVVEVGVDVPNATVMMIENGERFGLAQMHQLRGRVGRGPWQSYCIIVSGTANEETKKRLEILNRSNDGFEIAREDLKMRGPGDLFGIRQSGDLVFQIGDIWNDADILTQAAKLASETDLSSLSEAEQAAFDGSCFSGAFTL